MDMDLTPEQELLRESVRRTCTRHAGPDVVRKLENDPIGYSPALWSALGELGLHGLTVGEDNGGQSRAVDASISAGRADRTGGAFREALPADGGGLAAPRRG